MAKEFGNMAKDRSTIKVSPEKIPKSSREFPETLTKKVADGFLINNLFRSSPDV